MSALHAIPTPPASGPRRTRSPISRALLALADRASLLVCAGAPCLLSARFLRECADAWARKPEAVRGTLARLERTTDDPRFAELRALYVEALVMIGGAP